jgi:signal transduction histidine kinase
MVSAHRFLEAAEAELANGRPEQAAAHVEAAHTGLMAAIADTKRVLNALVPPGLEELGVANALEVYVRDRVPAGTDASVTGSLPRAEGWFEARLFALAVEAIRNAVVHGRPASIRIALSALRRTAIITVGDDGVVRARSRPQGTGRHGAQRHGSPGGWLRSSRGGERTGRGTTVRSASVAQMTDRTSRVVLIDDHELSRRGLEAMLSTADWVGSWGGRLRGGPRGHWPERPDIVLWTSGTGMDGRHFGGDCSRSSRSPS